MVHARQGLGPTSRTSVLLEPSGEIIDVEAVFRYVEGDVCELLGRRREFVSC